MKKKIAVILLLMFVIPVIAQQEKDHEVNSEIKELTEFHDVIYQIWHTAWPEKDVKLLKSLLPDVESGFKKIQNAKLPGILRDKKAKWEEGLKKFSACVDEYKSASAKNDDQTFLNAAEKLHMQYEALVRTIKPVLKEVDAFHQELYMLYHYYSPNYDYNKIKSSGEVLKLKIDDLMKTQLSGRLQSKQEKFSQARADLSVSVNNLNEEIAKGNNQEAITSAVNKMHSKYELLEKIFD